MLKKRREDAAHFVEEVQTQTTEEAVENRLEDPSRDEVDPEQEGHRCCLLPQCPFEPFRPKR